MARLVRIFWNKHLHLFNGDYTMVQISMKLGIKKATVSNFYYKFRDSLNLKIASKKAVSNKKKIIAELLEAGKTIEEIEEETHFTLKYICEIRKSLGYPNIKRTNNYTKEELLTIIRLYRNVPHAEIAKKLGRTERSVRQKIYSLKKAGDIV